MTRIVVYAPRPKRPARKEKVEAVDAGGEAVKQPPAVVVATSPKRLKWLRLARRMEEPRESDPEIDAFFARNVRAGGALPPPGKR